MEPTRSYRESGPGRDGGPRRAVRGGSRRDMAEAGRGGEARRCLVWCARLCGVTEPEGALGGKIKENV